MNRYTIYSVAISFNLILEVARGIHRFPYLSGSFLTDLAVFAVVGLEVEAIILALRRFKDGDE